MDKSSDKISIYTFQKPYSQKDGLFESFSLPILRYIFKNASMKQWKKLHKTCKLLFCWNPELLIDYFDVSGSQNYNPDTQSLCGYFLRYNKKKFENIYNIWLSNVMIFNSSKISFSTIRSKISRCEVKDLRLFNCTMSESDLNFLTKWGKTERFLLKKVTVYNPENVQLPFESLLSYASYADEIHISTTFTTAATSKTLAELGRTRKFKKFVVDQLDGILDHELIYKFIKKNAGINSYFSLQFLDDENTEVFKELLLSELLKLNWQSLLEKDSDQYPGFEEDEIYWQFEEFWDRLMTDKVYCCCCGINGMKKEKAPFQLKHQQRNGSKVENSKKKFSKKHRVWHFLVKKSRVVRRVIFYPFLI
uniref:F-box associated domain-containing protein n=1 Tax=Panagrolaimus sp. ES5 TaxID=591445 RepID=A0AC34G5P4_9BILA